MMRLVFGSPSSNSSSGITDPTQISSDVRICERAISPHQGSPLCKNATALPGRSVCATSASLTKLATGPPNSSGGVRTKRIMAASSAKRSSAGTPTTTSSLGLLGFPRNTKTLPRLPISSCEVNRLMSASRISKPNTTIRPVSVRCARLAVTPGSWVVKNL